MARSVPTFLVGAEEQREIMDQFQKRCLHFSEAYQKNKALSFTARAYQKTHPDKESEGKEDADATLASPMLLGICDGVSQVGDYGLDPSKLPRELLKSCEKIGDHQLFAGSAFEKEDSYGGPIALLKEAYSETESLGSTSVLLAVMDNTTLIHGKLHPMIGVVTLGDCELVMLRRTGGRQGRLQVVLHTEMQRIGGHNQTPLQLARLSESLDPAFDEDEALDAIERGSGLHCTSAYEGDVLILGSDGVFDNLFLSEVVDICNRRLAPSEHGGPYQPAKPALLAEIAQLIVEKAHAKSEIRLDRPVQHTPLGVGGKADDTSVVVAEVVAQGRRPRASRGPRELAMPYTRGDRVPEPPSRRGRAAVGQRAEGKSVVEDHFARAQAVEPQALEKLRGGSMYEALDLFLEVKRELAEAAHASGPGSPNYSMLMEASSATQQNIEFVNGFLPYEFLMEPKHGKR